MLVAEYYISSSDACSEKGSGPSGEMRVRGTPLTITEKNKNMFKINIQQIHISERSHLSSSTRSLWVVNK